ncbi:tetratricopeptide (TPR) repeat protein [Hamadaea flava]|uniref:Tetratricopeptide repeat protein n=1 Tax=Hamadaea flava TaxID=1742688 RepID=A0ABV8LU03_9ACTN|nr:hypothetical protein [Hamadaea flava]MCP2321783.1 tetratricopeptide (TPR) repeat protein [Hamadaea flava]
MARVVLVAGVALCALGVLGIVLHLVRRGRWRTLRSSAELYQRARLTLTSAVDTTVVGQTPVDRSAEVDRAVEIGQQALDAWKSAGTPPTSAALRVRVAGLALAYADDLRDAGRAEAALAHLAAAQQVLAERVDADPVRHRPMLADVLTATAAAEADLGHADEALRLDGRIVPLLRDLAQDRPTAYARQLGLALAAEARHFHEIGRSAEALAAAAEATALLRTADRAALASAGAGHAAILLAAGRDEEALAAVNEAVKHGAQGFDGHSFEHCVTLTVLGRCLLTLGRTPLAEAPLRDALALSRAAATRHPHRGRSWLADSLTATAEMLTVLDRPADAVAAAQEATQLAPSDSGLQARALWALSAALVADGRPADARTPAAEAVELYKRLVAARPGRHHREQAQAQELLSRL